MRACVPTCLHANVVYVPTCLRANVPKACQLLISTCQRAKVPYDVPMFQLGVRTCQTACQLSHNEMKCENFVLFLLLCKKFYICICIVHNNCIILHFYTDVILKKSMWNFSFFFFFFGSLVGNENMKIPGFYTLQVT